MSTFIGLSLLVQVVYVFRCYIIIKKSSSVLKAVKSLPYVWRGFQKVWGFVSGRVVLKYILMHTSIFDTLTQ